MIRKEITVNNIGGKENRPIAVLVGIANEFSSRIYFSSDERCQINGKSYMGMMTLGLYPGEIITVTAEGEDEKEAAEKIEAYLTAK